MAANGHLPLSSLTKVDGWAYLETNTARAWVAVCNELVALGYPRPTITAPDGAYRTYAQQVYWKNFWTAKGKPGNASTPGFSNHGLGTCVDVWNVSKWPTAVLTRVMNKYGFVNDFAPEPWHWHRTSINPADSSITPIGDDMPLTKEDLSLLLNTAAYTGGPSISQVLKNIDVEIAPIQRDGALVPKRQDDADTNTMVRQLVARVAAPAAGGSASVDVAPLIKAISELPVATVAALKAAL